MSDKSNEKLTPNARKLRKQMTDEERKLWYLFLRNTPVPVHRQKVIGSYIVDFYCAKAKLVIEVDGRQHYEQDGLAADTVRDANLKNMGLTVIRYSNADINYRFDAVCEDILKHIVNGIQD